MKQNHGNKQESMNGNSASKQTNKHNGGQVNKQTSKLATMLSMGAFTGTIPIAAMKGMFTIENAPILAFLMIA